MNKGTQKMMDKVEAKVGRTPTAEEVWDAVTGIVEEADKLILIGDNMPSLIERMVYTYWDARGVNTSMPAGHRCHGGEFTECTCPR